MELYLIISEVKRLEQCRTLDDIILREKELMLRIAKLMRNPEDQDTIPSRLKSVLERHVEILRRETTRDPMEEVNRVLIALANVLGRRLTLKEALMDISQSRVSPLSSLRR